LEESSYSNKTLANRAGIVGGVARNHCLRGCDTKVRVARLHPHARRLFVVIIERAQKLDLDPRGFVKPTRIGYEEP